VAAIRTPKHYLVASDFDQTLSFNDSGLVLSELLGVAGFAEKVEGLARSHLVQQGGELAYLIRHDPEFRGVRREHLAEAGRRVRVKRGIPAVLAFLASGVEDCRFSFFVISAAPREIVEAALSPAVPPHRIHATEFEYDEPTGEVRAIRCVPAGHGKVAVIEDLRRCHGIPPDRVVYIGDGSSDIHVMLHVNHRDGFTIAVSEHPQLTRIARSTVLSDHAFSVLVPLLEQVFHRPAQEIRAICEAHGLTLQDWGQSTTNRLILSETLDSEGAPGRQAVAQKVRG
jgi:HAD superfamily phosphoserine phosphatase-like hydrolase